MARLSAAITILCLTTLLLSTSGKGSTIDEPNVRMLTLGDLLADYCRSGYIVQPSYLCDAYTTTAATSNPSPPTPATTMDDDGELIMTTTQSNSDASSSVAASSGTPLENAHWCQLKNGTYLSLNQTFMYNECAFCQCTKSHAIGCINPPCMKAYCIDGSTPVVRKGQCCAQCAYETASNSCTVNGIIFPHGTILRQTSDAVQCWCQAGTVECRKGAASLLGGMDYWGEGTAVYVVVIVVCVLLILGTLLCCAGGVFFYYRHYNNQQAAQEAYATYYNNGGWQEMSENGEVIVDGYAQEKQAEAEQQQGYEYPVEQSPEFIPPPYALYGSSHAHAQNEKAANLA